MVLSVEGDGVLRPLEGPGGFRAWEGGVELAGELLELVVRLWRLRPTKDAGNGATRGLVAAIFLVREVVVLFCGVGLISRWFLVAALASAPAVATASAATALCLLALLAQPFKVEAGLCRVAVPVVVDVERAVVVSSLSRLRGVPAGALRVRLCRENRGGLALGLLFLLVALGPLA